MKSFFIISLFCAFLSLDAQNLVPDPTFGDFYNQVNACGAIDTGITAVNRSIFYRGPKVLKHWSSPTYTTAGIYDSICGNVPSNSFDYQIPYDGSGYASIRIYHHNDGFNPPQSIFSDSRSYVQTNLTDSLKKGHFYRVSFYVSPTFYIINSQANYYSTSTIGAYLSSNRITDFPQPIREDSNVLHVIPQIQNDPNRFLDDTTVWYRVCGIMNAEGGERWLTIGNFEENQNSNIKLLRASTGPTITYHNATYFIDYVTVEEVQNIIAGKTFKDTLFCVNKNFSQTLRARPGASTYLWNNGSTLDSLVVDTFGTYWLIADYGCGLEIDTFKILPKSQISLNLGLDIDICESEDSVLLSAPSGFDSYQWSNGDISSKSWVKLSGTYSLIARYPCDTLYDTIHVLFRSKPPPPIVYDTGFCVGANNQLLVIGSNLLWYDSISDPNPLSIEPTFFSSLKKTDSIYVSQSINNCESNLLGVKMLFEDSVAVKLMADTVLCGNDSLWIGEEPLAGVKYIWSTSDTDSKIEVKSSGKYWLEASNYCNVSSDSMVITFIPTPPPPFVWDSLYCDDIPSSINQMPVLGNNLIWYPDLFSEVGMGMPHFPNTDFIGKQKYFVSQFVDKCESDRIDFEIRMNKKPQLDLDSVIELCSEGDRLLEVSSKYEKVKWSTGSTMSFIEIDSSGFYSILVSNVCGSDSMKTRVVLMDCQTKIYIPNVFSPNGDGVNDLFAPFGENFSLLRISIFNRWGELIFQGNNAWDGRFNGEKNPSGTYFAQIEYLDSQLEKKQIKGMIQLIR